MSCDFIIAETASFRKQIAAPLFRRIYEKIRNHVYPQLRENPFFGNNIKKLKGSWSGVYRYRIGDYRLFYVIDGARVMVFVFDISDRKDSYR